MSFQVGTRVDLVGGYYADSYGGGGCHTKAVGWPNLRISRIVDLGRKAPYLIDDGDGGIGWAPASSIRVAGGGGGGGGDGNAEEVRKLREELEALKQALAQRPPTAPAPAPAAKHIDPLPPDIGKVSTEELQRLLAQRQ